MILRKHCVRVFNGSVTFSQLHNDRIYNFDSIGPASNGFPYMWNTVEVHAYLPVGISAEMQFYGSHRIALCYSRRYSRNRYDLQQVTIKLDLNVQQLHEMPQNDNNCACFTTVQLVTNGFRSQKSCISQGLLLISC